MSLNSPTRRQRKPKKPLDQAHLEALALHYVGRYATSRAKVERYLARKIRERGWDGAGEPEIGSIVEKFSAMGYINDALYAASRARDLAARGYGEGRLRQRLSADGIGEEASVEAREIADTERVSSALAFARRRRLGPFAREKIDDPKLREKAFAAMIRAGHGFALARAILALEIGQAIDEEALRGD